MKEIVVISGKGGTGKTSITAAFAYLEASKLVLADCDVDAADLHLLMQPDFAEKNDFYSGKKAIINSESCSNCGACAEVCRFGAVSQTVDNKYFITPINCEGCGYCARICPTECISLVPAKTGNLFKSEIKTGATMIHAALNIGADNSGKLVTQVKTEARKIAQLRNKEIILIDGSPGIGCPVIASLSGANYIVFVTEPTVSGFHDLKRVHQLVEKHGIESACIINKADINNQLSTEIKAFLKTEKILLLAEIPYCEDFTKAMVEGKTIIEFNNSSSKIAELIVDSWYKIKQANGMA